MTGEKLLVVGHVNVDHEMEVPYLPRADITVPILSKDEFLGGTAANVARWSSRFGLKVDLCSFVGADFPEEFLKLLQRERVGTSQIVVRRGFRTPSCWITKDRHGHQCTLIDQGAMEGTGNEKLPDLENVGWVHLGTGEPAYLLRLARAARRARIPIAVDPAQELLYRWQAPELSKLFALSEIFFGNAGEARAALNILGLSRPHELVSCVPLAIVTMGKRGARAYTRRGVLSCPAPLVTLVRGVTGAGDAFRGAFYSGWLKGAPLEICLEQGTKAGSAVVRTPRQALQKSLPFGQTPF